MSDTGEVFRDGKPLKSHNRGNITGNGTRYQAVNISIYDDNGKFAKQIKYYVHRLVAEAFIENPNNLSDVDHIDCNKENNHVDNLRWYTRQQNVARNALPEGTIVKHKNKRSNPTKYIKKDGNWVLIPSEKPPWNKGLKGSSWNTGMKYGVEDGTIRKRANGYYYIKKDGKWAHLSKKDYIKYGINK
ncbi:MAG: HNH endonuclease signature motif containing protein [Candidatus Nanopelagicaceae bacterium]